RHIEGEGSADGSPKSEVVTRGRGARFNKKNPRILSERLLRCVLMEHRATKQITRIAIEDSVHCGATCRSNQALYQAGVPLPFSVSRALHMSGIASAANKAK